MEILGTKVEVINVETGCAEASVTVQTPLSQDKTERAIVILSSVVSEAFNRDDQTVALTYNTVTDIQI